MRIIALVGTITGTLLRAYLGSVIGYAGFFAWQLLQGSLWRWIALLAVPLWGLLMGVASLPIAVWSCVVAQLAGSFTGAARWPALLLGLAIAALSSTLVFIWYMTALFGLLDWWSRWPWPLAASLCAYLIECGWRRPASPAAAS